MMIVKRFSATKILNTNLGVGFKRGRKYDTDLDRLGRMDTSQRELSRVGELRKEMNKLSKELRGGLNGNI